MELREITFFFEVNILSKSHCDKAGVSGVVSTILGSFNFAKEVVLDSNAVTDCTLKSEFGDREKFSGSLCKTNESVLCSFKTVETVLNEVE